MRGISTLAVSLCLVACGAVPSLGEGTASGGRPQAELPPGGRPACADAPEGCTRGAGVAPLAGYAPTLPPEDLAPVAAALAEADIVGLGEAAHASAGFLGIKVRLSRELIERHGFRAVTWETARVPMRKLDAYVQTCVGDPTQATIDGLDVIWADVQTRDFARWLCEWNRGHPNDRVQVHGVDVQDPRADRTELEQFFERAVPNEARGWMAALDACERAQGHAACTAGIAKVRGNMDARREELASRGTPAGLATAHIALTSYEAWQDATMIPGYAESFEARDIGMARVLEQLRALHFPGKKTVLWAHNIHVVKRHETVADSWVGGPIVTQGTQLDRDLGPGRYRTLALIGWDVFLNRPGQRGHVNPVPTEASLEARLHELGRGALFVDLHHPNVGEVVPAGRAFELGAPGVEVHVPADNYDGILFLDASPMAEVL